MSDTQEDLSPNELLARFQKALLNIIENGRDVPDGNGGVVKVTADAKYFEVLGSHLKDNEITVGAAQSIKKKLERMQQTGTNMLPPPSIGHAANTEDDDPAALIVSKNKQ